MKHVNLQRNGKQASYIQQQHEQVQKTHNNANSAEPTKNDNERAKNGQMPFAWNWTLGGALVSCLSDAAAHIIMPSERVHTNYLCK